MFTEIYIEALLVDEDPADQVWEAWDKWDIDDQVAGLAYLFLTSEKWSIQAVAMNRLH